MTRLRRCHGLLVELDDAHRFDVSNLLGGGDGLDRRPRWLAHTPALDEPVEVSLAQLAVLAGLAAGEWCDAADLVARHGDALVAGLLDAGLLIESARDGEDGSRDEAVATLPWWPPALHAQHAGAWKGVDIEARNAAGLMTSSAERVAALGPAPTHDYRRQPEADAILLPRPVPSGFDALLARRRTCRNFDAAAALPLQDFATLLQQVWGAVGTRTLAPGAVVVKKTSPAGGGLHAIEAYVLVQRVEGLPPGLYHYLSAHHGLEVLEPMAPEQAAGAVHRFLAGQHWFRDASAIVVMTARFDRLFWKYRRHAKAWRVLHLDAGHLSQTLYLAAAERGLGAFVTAAINDRDIEKALRLEPLREAAIAIVGFGPQAAGRANIELDALDPTPATRRFEAG